MTASSGLLLDVSTQKDWQRRCRPVKFCYICGGLLATHDKNVAISAEHIIPRSVLDHFLQPGMCSWKATISVHACCETSHKRDADTFLNLLGRVSAGDDGPPTRADALALVKKLSVSMLPGGGSPTPSIAGVADSYVAVNRWVQGVYAVVFGEYLPLDPDWPPIAGVPECRHHLPLSPQQQIADWLRLHQSVRHALLAAQHAGVLCRASIPCHGFEFKCSFTRVASQSMFAWALSVPLLTQQSQAMNGHPVPWRGFMPVASIPESAAVFCGHLASPEDSRAKKA